MKPKFEKSPRRRWWSMITRWLTAASLGWAATWLLGQLALPLVPLPTGLFEPPEGGVAFVDRHGRALRQTIGEADQFSRTTAFGEIPSIFISATLAAEDRRFWRHHGIDWAASARALRDLVRYSRATSGGSTITQQLIKLSDRRPRTVQTKLWEALQARRLEQIWDKQRILREYLQRLEYGRLCRGPAAAAEFYLGKPLRDLSVAEAAFLAGLPQAPSRLNPYRHRDRATRRQRWVLQQMRAAGDITSAEFKRALEESMQLKNPARCFRAPHFVDFLLQQETVVRRANARLETTLDLDLNDFVQHTVTRNVSRLRDRHVRNAAAVVIDNASGDILAYVGSEDYFSDNAGQVDGVQAKRSPGSTLKPFTYLLAFEQGATPATVVADVPVEFATPTGVFAPVNYNRHCYGPIRYRMALANSLNIPALKVLASVGGAEILHRRLRACGVTTLAQGPGHYGLGLTLGNAELRLLELANAYACLARLGIYKPPRWHTAVEIPASPADRPRQVADPAACYLIADILDDDHARTLAFGAESDLRFEFPVACKTGTSTDFRDNWALGYTPEFTVGVWVGNFDGTSMDSVSGVTGAGPIFHEIFVHLHQRYGTSWYPPLPSVVEHSIHPITGKRLNAPATESVREKFMQNHLPPFEEPGDYDFARRIRLTSEYRAWFDSPENWLGSRAVITENDRTLRLIRPLPGTVFFLDADLPENGGRLHLQADGPADLEWQSKSLECRREGNKSFVRLTEGEHRLTVRSQSTGEQRETWVVVRRM